MNLGMMGGNPAIFGGSCFFGAVSFWWCWDIFNPRGPSGTQISIPICFWRVCQDKIPFGKKVYECKKKARIYCMLSLGDITCHQTLSQVPPHVHTSAPFCTHTFSTSASASRVQAWSDSHIRTHFVPWSCFRLVMLYFFPHKMHHRGISSFKDVFCPYFQPAMICKSQVLVCASVCHSWRQPWGILPASGLTRTPSCFWGELLRPQNGWRDSYCKIATGTVPYLSLPITPTSNSTHSLEQLPHRRSYSGSPSRLFIIWLNPKRPVFVKVSNQQIFAGLFFLAVVSLTSTGIGRRGLLWTNWWFWEVLRQDDMWHPWMGGCFLGSRHKWQ